MFHARTQTPIFDLDLYSDLDPRSGFDLESKTLFRGLPELNFVLFLFLSHFWVERAISGGYLLSREFIRMMYMRTMELRKKEKKYREIQIWTTDLSFWRAHFNLELTTFTRYSTRS